MGIRKEAGQGKRWERHPCVHTVKLVDSWSGGVKARTVHACMQDHAAVQLRSEEFADPKFFDLSCRIVESHKCRDNKSSDPRKVEELAEFFLACSPSRRCLPHHHRYQRHRILSSLVQTRLQLRWSLSHSPRGTNRTVLIMSQFVGNVSYTLHPSQKHERSAC